MQLEQKTQAKEQQISYKKCEQNIGTLNDDVDADETNNLDTSTKGDIGYNDNSKTKHPKIINFSINNITGYDYFI